LPVAFLVAGFLVLDFGAAAIWYHSLLKPLEGGLGFFLF
jgi:hypothetical protein